MNQRLFAALAFYVFDGVEHTPRYVVDMTSPVTRDPKSGLFCLTEYGVSIPIADYLKKVGGGLQSCIDNKDGTGTITWSLPPHKRLEASTQAGEMLGGVLGDGEVVVDVRLTVVEQIDGGAIQALRHTYSVFPTTIH